MESKYSLDKLEFVSKTFYICICTHIHTQKTHTYVCTRNMHIYVLMFGTWLAQSSRAQGPCKQCTTELRAHCLFSCVQVQWCPPVQLFLFLSSKYWTWSRSGKGEVKTHLRTLGPQLYPRGIRSLRGSRLWGRTARFGQGTFSIIRICLYYCICFQGRSQQSAFSLSEEPTTQTEYTVVLLIHS